MSQYAQTASLPALGVLGDKRLFGGLFHDHWLHTHGCTAAWLVFLFVPFSQFASSSSALRYKYIFFPPFSYLLFAFLFSLYDSTTSHNSIFFNIPFFSGSFLVLQAVLVGFAVRVLTFRSWSTLNCSYMRCELWVQIHYFACGYLFQNHLLKKQFFPYWMVWHHCQKPIDCRCMGLFLDSQLYSIDLCVNTYISTTLFWFL